METHSVSLLHHTTSRRQRRAFPADLADHPGRFQSQLSSEADYRRLAEDIARISPDRAVFLLLDPGFWTPNLQQILADRGPLRSLGRFPEVMLFVSPGKGSEASGATPPASGGNKRPPGGRLR